MDGNGRWAKEQGLPRTRGHREGIKSVQDVTQASLDLGIRYLSLYAFSTENWSRSSREVNYLMGRLERFLRTERPKMLERSIRLHPIGRLHELPKAVLKELDKTIQATRECSRMTVCLALNYGSRGEIVDTCRRLAERVKAGELSPGDIDQEVFAQHLYTAGIPDPDLLIRTAGEMRVSNFLLWQISYAEFYVSRVYWPDFRREHLERALTAYARRERRFGSA